MNEDLTALVQVLQDVAQLPQRREHTVTFLEIAGYPHLENVASNILAFYLQSSNPHTLEDLVFRALMLLLDAPILEDTVVTARREDITTSTTRIDLVVETDDVIIGIENKIYHHLNNDLSIYWEHLKLLAHGRNVYGIVLSLHPVRLPLGESSFVNITYLQLFDQVDHLRIGRSSSSHYELYFQDFCETIIHLSKGTDMDYERLSFFQHYNQSISVLLNEVHHLRKEMRSKLEKLAEIHQIKDRFYSVPIKKGTWSSETEIVEVLTYEIAVSPKVVLQIDIVLEIHGWRMQFFNRRGDRATVQAWIDQRHLPYRVQPKPWRLRLAMETPIPYETDIWDVCGWSMSIIQQVLP